MACPYGQEREGALNPGELRGSRYEGLFYWKRAKRVKRRRQTGEDRKRLENKISRITKKVQWFGLCCLLFHLSLFTATARKIKLYLYSLLFIIFWHWDFGVNLTLSYKPVWSASVQCFRRLCMVFCKLFSKGEARCIVTCSKEEDCVRCVSEVFESVEEHTPQLPLPQTQWCLLLNLCHRSHSSFKRQNQNRNLKKRMVAQTLRNECSCHSPQFIQHVISAPFLTFQPTQISWKAQSIFYGCTHTLKAHRHTAAHKHQIPSAAVKALAC